MNIIGTGRAHPSLTVTNEMLSRFLDTSDEWITTRTGIKQRQLISHEKLEDLAAEACNNALEDAGISAKDIDFFICSNVVNEYITPSLSCIVQGMIGATCACFDLNSACAGFIYALDIANSFFKTKKEVNHILILCAEEPTRMCDWQERSTCVLFGDGAAAVVLSRGDDFIGSSLSSFSCVEPLYQIRELEKTPFITKEEFGGPLVMKGQEVFKLAVKSSLSDIRKVVEDNGYTYDEVDYYLLHQANIRIIDTIRRSLDQDEVKFPHNIRHYGNTSSASLPILLDELNRNQTLNSGDTIVLSAFGAGFTSGACLLNWSKQ
ncbi:MAG: ketoacyl-ACP synthase III [Bacteroidales bacterium]|nr:ketoacyl-ACP synthase III [Bacteroidales bacterium]